MVEQHGPTMPKPTTLPRPKLPPLIPRGSRWVPAWGFRVPDFMMRREPRLANLSQNPIYHLLALESRCRGGNGFHFAGAISLISGLGILAYIRQIGTALLPPAWVGVLLVGVGLVMFRIGARREKPIAWATLDSLWTETLLSAPVSAEETLNALWGATCRRSRVFGMALLAAVVFLGAVALTVSESVVALLLQWFAAFYAGFISVVWLSPYPALAQCRAITRMARPGPLGLGRLGKRILNIIALVFLIYGVLAVVFYVTIKLLTLVSVGRVDMAPFTNALQYCAATPPWVRLTILAGLAVVTNRLVTWRYQRRFPRHWAAALENLEKYMRSESPRFISMSR